MQDFVKKVTKTTIIKTIDAVGPSGALVSIIPFENNKAINLVIGAKYRDAYAPSFSKEGLKELILILQEVHDALD